MADIYEPSWDPEQVTRTRLGYTLLFKSKGLVISEQLTDELMEGTIDCHIHAGPEANVARLWDEIDVAERATDNRMKAVVFKCHASASSARKSFVQRWIDRYASEKGKTPVTVVGGVVLNNTVGGLNPDAVVASAKFGGRYVWTPTFDARQHRRIMGWDDKDAVIVVDDEGKVTQAMREVMKLAADYDQVLCLCHHTVAERFALIDEAKKLGVKRVVIAHPQLSISKATPEQQKEMVERGAMVEMCWQSAVPNLTNYTVRPDEMVRIIELVGADNIVSGTDVGQVQNPHPVDAMRMFIRSLLLLGISQEQIRKIFVENPRRLIFE